MFSRRDPFPDFPERPPGIHRCLLLAQESSPTPRLCRLMEERCQSGPTEMHVLVSRFRRSVLVTDPALGPRVVGKKKADERITVDSIDPAP